METERLELIPLCAEELQLWVEHISELERRYNCSYQGEKMEGFFLDIVKKQVEMTKNDEGNYLWHTFWLIVRKEGRIVVGSADFKNIPNEKGEVEIGYGLGKAFEHNGYMTETVKFMCDWALKQEAVSCVIAETETDNLKSQKVLECCQFKKYKEENTIWWIRT